MNKIELKKGNVFVKIQKLKNQIIIMHVQDDSIISRYNHFDKNKKELNKKIKDYIEFYKKIGYN